MLQWCVINASSDCSLHIKEEYVESALFEVWKNILKLHLEIAVKKAQLLEQSQVMHWNGLLVEQSENTSQLSQNLPTLTTLENYTTLWKIIYSSLHQMPLTGFLSFDQEMFLSRVLPHLREGDHHLCNIVSESSRHAKQASQMSSKTELSQSMTTHEIDELEQSGILLDHLHSKSTLQHSLLIHSIQLNNGD